MELEISDKQLKRIQKAREYIGEVKANPFTREEIERIYKLLIERKAPYVSTGCFKFYLSKTKKNFVAKFDRPIKLNFAIRGKNES